MAPRQLKDQIRKYYQARGVVLGKYWGGGSGSYPSRRYGDKSMKKLTQQIKNDFQSGGLDSGMGYEKLTGALMHIDTITTREIKGRPFTNIESKKMILGKLKRKDRDFLEESDLQL